MRLALRLHPRSARKIATVPARLNSRPIKMSDYHIVPEPVDAQTRSKFFFLPLEIRHIFYGYLIPQGVHIFIQDGRIRASECVEHTRDGNHDGFECRTTGNWSADIIWARRLLSQWNFHWRCEEVALRLNTFHKQETDRTTVESIVLVCKRM